MRAVVVDAEAAAEVDPRDPDLQELSGSYVTALGEQARLYAAPAFVLLQALVEALPNPTLTEDEELQKIELG